MKIAVIGSRNITVKNLGRYLPEDVTELVSGGAKGVDACARAYATAHGLRLTEFLPEYSRYGRAAPLRRNLQIVAYADAVLAFWDGRSKGTAFTIQACEKQHKPVQIIMMEKEKSMEQRFEEEMKNFCENVVNLRRSRRYSKKDFARLMGVSVATLNLIEQGQAPLSIRLSTVSKLQQSFGIRVFDKDAWQSAV